MRHTKSRGRLSSMPSALKPKFPVARLRAWYRATARNLPWRSADPEPYHVFLSEVMLQQTTVAAVLPRYRRFLERWPTIAALAAAPLEDVLGEWAGLGYYARARNFHRAANVVAEAHGGILPDTEEELRRLPGVGPYTAAAVAAIAFGRRAVVVDGNVERVLARWFALETPFPDGKGEARRLAEAIWPAEEAGDFAQALMDLGAGPCAARGVACDLCPIAEGCAAKRSGAPEAYPRRKPKAEKPSRRGAVFALFDGRGRVLVERRPERGLLGGMDGLPGTPWSSAEDAGMREAFAPAAARWRQAETVRHVFTHFALELEIYVATAAPNFDPPAGARWAEIDTLRLPTVMAKALASACRCGAVQ